MPSKGAIFRSPLSHPPPPAYTLTRFDPYESRFIVRYFSWPHAVVLLFPAGVYAGRGTRRSRIPPHVRTVRYVPMYCLCSRSHRASDYVYDGSTLFRLVEPVLRPHTLTSYHPMSVESNESYSPSLGCITCEYRYCSPAMRTKYHV